MADLNDYQTVAPNLATGMTLSQIQDALDGIPSAPTPPDPDHELTQPKKDALLVDFTSEHSISKSVDSQGGWGSLAKKHVLSIKQVKDLCLEAEAMLNVHNS